MLGSFQDAEDAVQDTFLRAWRSRDTFEGRSTLRTWLYRIATNACLDLIAKRRPAPAAGGEVLWLEPYPDRLLDELLADPADEPEVVAVARETIELAYIAAVQHLAPRPRAVLVLRDVLGWPAKEVADLLGDSVNSVNSALQRARAGMREHLPAERQEWTGAEDDADNRELVRRFTEASVAADVDTIATMLRDDVRFSMPPTQGVIVGRDAVIADWVEGGYPEMAGLRVDRHLGQPPARRRLLHLERAGGRLRPDHDRRAADQRRPGHRGDHLRPRAVPAPRPPREPARGRRPVIRLARAGLLATLAAAATTGLVAAVAGAAGVDLVVDGGELPASGIAFVTGVFSLVGVALAAALLRWTGRPADLFVRIAVGLTVLSLVPPLLWAEGAASAITLVVLHLMAAAIMIPALTRSLRPALRRPPTGHFLALRRRDRAVPRADWA